MGDGNIKNLVETKLFLIDCFLFTSSNVKTKGKEEVLKHGATSYFLQSVVLELIIKIFYEIDFREQAPFTHDILDIFNKLTPKYKKFIKEKYNESRKRKQRKFKKIDDEVPFPPIEEALKSNKKLIKNFKYDAHGARNNSAADGQFYKEIINFIKSEI